MSNARPPHDLVTATNRQAVDALGGYVYQLYRTMLAWMEIRPTEFLLIETGEDFDLLLDGTIDLAQVKRTRARITINTPAVRGAIERYVQYRARNPQLSATLQYLTTSDVGKETSAEHRIGDKPFLQTWRELARAGDLSEFREKIEHVGLNEDTLHFIRSKADHELRQELLRKVRFETGHANQDELKDQILALISDRLKREGGTQLDAEKCFSAMFNAIAEKATRTSDRYLTQRDLDTLFLQFTHTTIPRDQHQAIVESALGLDAAKPRSVGLSSTTMQLAEIGAIPLPAALAERKTLVEDALTKLQSTGVAWLQGATGCGKTTVARLSCRQASGDWFGCTVRGYETDRLVSAFEAISQYLIENNVSGIVIDDLDLNGSDKAIDALITLLDRCKRLDVPLIITAAREPPTKIKSLVPDCDASITKVGNLSQADILEVLAAHGVSDESWARYIEASSGWGHPQLVDAMVRSMAAQGWDMAEFRELSSLVSGNEDTEQVRAEARQRLLDEMSAPERELLARLSLLTFPFDREHVLAVGKLPNSIAESGTLLDRLVGPWIDQIDSQHYELSPILKNLAPATLSADERQGLQIGIAHAILNRRQIGPNEATAVILLGLASEDGGVLTRICMGLLNDSMETISDHLSIVRLLSHNQPIFPKNPIVNQLLRGVQLLSTIHSQQDETACAAALESFMREAELIDDAEPRQATEILVLAKILLIRDHVPVALPVLDRFFALMDGPAAATMKSAGIAIDEFTDPAGKTPVQMLVLLRLFQAKSIAELRAYFDFLDQRPKLRAEFLKLFEQPEFEFDMVVSSAWLAEHKAKTMEADRHVPEFAEFETLARKWGCDGLAVVCRKYQAVIADEYGNSPDQAHALLEEGLNAYGANNGVLLRAKGKVLFRQKEFGEALPVLELIAKDRLLTNDVELAMMLREAAISAEELRQYAKAADLYLRAEPHARACSVSGMQAMAVGLVADAALAHWHDGSRSKSLELMANALAGLESVDESEGLHGAHCQAVVRHIVLYIDQEASGELRQIADGEPTVVFPGVASNPEPQKDIAERQLTSLDMAWYMLAAAEAHAGCDVGIAAKLDDRLGGHRLREGEFLLCQARLSSAIAEQDEDRFFDQLPQMLEDLAAIKSAPRREEFFTPLVPQTYVARPMNSSEKAELSGTAGEFCVLFLAVATLCSPSFAIDKFAARLLKDERFTVSDVFLDGLRKTGNPPNSSSWLIEAAPELQRQRRHGETVQPESMYMFVLRIIEIADRTGQLPMIAAKLYEVIASYWQHTWEHQRFRLKSPMLHEPAINDALANQNPSELQRLIKLMAAIAPLLNFSNPSNIQDHLRTIAQKHPV